MRLESKTLSEEEVAGSGDDLGRSSPLSGVHPLPKPSNFPGVTGTSGREFHDSLNDFGASVKTS